MREQDASDRRAHVVAITPAGSRLHVAVRADIRAMEEQVLGGLGERERSTLLSALRKLVRQR